MFKFIHAADIHLDSPLVNLDRYDGAPVEAFRRAARRAFDNMIDLALREQVKFVLIAGDLYDGDCADFNTPLHFRRQMERLRESDIRVYLVQGNHDAANKMKKAFRLELPDNVHLFKTNRAETVVLEDLGVAIHGQGFAKQAIEDDLSAGYPSPKPDLFNIGMLHTSCGPYEAHDTYAPSTVQGLTAKGYDFWALGHIHKRSQLAGPSPMIWYPGNLQGRHINEQGPKGCSIVSVQAGEPVKVHFEAVDVLRWQTCVVDASDCDTVDDVISGAQSEIAQLLDSAGGRPVAVRVEITGESPVHRELRRYEDKWDAELRLESVDRFDEQVWIEKIKFRTRPASTATNYSNDDGPLAELVVSIQAAEIDDGIVDKLRTDLEKMLRNIPSDPRTIEDAIDLDDQGQVKQLVADARELLVGRLLETGGPA